ncbi:MAG: plastocyanin [Planctomycetota bacterium]|jgi:plastocyanin
MTKATLVSSICILATAGLALASAPVVYAPDVADVQEECCEEPAYELRTVFVQPEGASSEGTGKAHGRVVFEGEVPIPSELSISEAQSKGCRDDGSKVDAKAYSLLIGADKGVANAVVMITLPVAEGAQPEKMRVPEKPIVLDQAQCRFTHRVVLVPVGATLEFRNSDSVPHNVHVYAMKNKAFNRTLMGGASLEVKVDKAEAIQIKCDIHPWMASYVYVTDTNYAALTDEHGAFEIPGLPAGIYTAKVWHEKLGKSEVQIMIGADGASEAVELAMKAKVKRSRRRR